MKLFLPSFKWVLLIIILFCVRLAIAQAPDVQYQPLIPVSAGLSAPIEVVNAPGQATQRLYVVEQRGTIRIWDGTQLLSPAFLDIQSIVNFDGNERGLLSVAFPPNYPANGGFFYCYYNDNAGNVTVSRFQVSADPNIANPTPNPAAPLISIPKPFTNHNGGHLQFRNEGGVNYLYFATGDGGSANDPNNYAQNYSNYLGKMIRINVDAPSPVPQIWAWGLRNPFRWSFDNLTGDIWIGDVGQGSREELNFRAGGTIGANYGWPCMEGTQVNASAPTSGRCDTVVTTDVLPIFDYVNPTLGRSIVGGYVYRGTEFPQMQGYYFFTDYFSTRLWMVRPNGSGGWDISSKTGMITNIASISQGLDGSLYAVSLNGPVYKLVVPIVTPLHLTGFTGKSYSTHNELSWVTESEEGMDKYVIEYSTDARSFSVLGEVNARNNSDRNNYSYRHNFTAPIAATIYYRLRMEEINNTYSYSPVIMLGDGRYTGIKIYPTVIQTRVMNIMSGVPVERVNITNTAGRLVMSRQLNGLDGYFNIFLTDLPKGYYFVQVISSGKSQTEKILIQ